MTKKRLTQEQRNALIEAAKAGANYGDLATQYGITRAAVSQIATKAGVRRRAVRKPHEAADGQPEPEASSDE